MIIFYLIIISKQNKPEWEATEMYLLKWKKTSRYTFFAFSQLDGKSAKLNYIIMHLSYFQ